MSYDINTGAEPQHDGYAQYPTDSPDWLVTHYAMLYDIAWAAGNGRWVEASRELLFSQLSEYRNCLDSPEELRKPIAEWTRFQKTIHFASEYAKSYLSSSSPEATMIAIQRDMREENRTLPTGVAEWIVRTLTTEVVDDDF